MHVTWNMTRAFPEGERARGMGDGGGGERGRARKAGIRDSRDGRARGDVKSPAPAAAPPAPFEIRTERSLSLSEVLGERPLHGLVRRPRDGDARRLHEHARQMRRGRNPPSSSRARTARAASRTPRYLSGARARPRPPPPPPRPRARAACTARAAARAERAGRAGRARRRRGGGGEREASGRAARRRRPRRGRRGARARPRARRAGPASGVWS